MNFSISHFQRLLWSGLAVILGLATPKTTAAPVAIEPGTIWHDTDGHVIQAHGPGMLKVGNTYYWFGEDKTEGASFQNVKCYSSTDLGHWRFESNALTRQESGDLGPHRVVERPKVLYNRTTKTYVMYLHIDSSNYSEAKVGVAVSQSVTGPYTYRSSFRPLGHQSRDMTLHEEEDGTGYLVFEDRARGLSITRLTPDYLNVEREIALIPRPIEGPAVVHANGLYYILGSRLTGWAPNANFYVTAPSLEGPWSENKPVAPSSDNTFESQTAFILPVTGSEGTTFVYIGDRWKSNNLSDSRYVWLPLEIKEGIMRLVADEPWTSDVKVGKAGKISWTPRLPEGDYRLVEADSGRVLAVGDDATNNGARVVGLPGERGAASRSAVWHMKPQSDYVDTYTITNLNSSQVLEVFSRETKPRAAVTQWSSHGGLNQLWKLVPLGNDPGNDPGNVLYSLENKNSDLQLGLETLALASEVAPAVQLQTPKAAPIRWRVERVH